MSDIDALAGTDSVTACLDSVYNDLVEINAEVQALTAGNVAWTYVDKTASYVIVASTDTYGTKVFTNDGATGTITFSLPAGAAAMRVSFNVVDAFTLKILAATGGKIRYKSTQTAAAGYLQSATVGDFITLEWNGDEWVVTAIEGHNWTDGTATLNIATATLRGDVELATSAETITGTDTDRAVTPVGLAAANTFVQWVNVQSGGVMTTTTAIPHDDTIPQKTEGMQVMAVTITPKSASNTLIIETVAMLSLATGAQACTTALFQDDTTGALAAMSSQTNANVPTCVKMTHKMTAGTTAATTFKARVGAAANTLTFNGIIGGRIFGGVAASSVTIYEVR